MSNIDVREAGMRSSLGLTSACWEETFVLAAETRTITHVKEHSDKSIFAEKKDLKCWICLQDTED